MASLFHRFHSLLPPVRVHQISQFLFCFRIRHTCKTLLSCFPGRCQSRCGALWGKAAHCCRLMPPRSCFPESRGAWCSLTVSPWGLQEWEKEGTLGAGREARTGNQVPKVLLMAFLLPIILLNPGPSFSCWPLPPLQCTKDTPATIFSVFSSSVAVLDVCLALISLIWTSRGERSGDRRWFTSFPSWDGTDGHCFNFLLGKSCIWYWWCDQIIIILNNIWFSWHTGLCPWHLT